jgi:hypothetical protein
MVDMGCTYPAPICPEKVGSDMPTQLRMPTLSMPSCTTVSCYQKWVTLGGSVELTVSPQT